MYDAAVSSPAGESVYKYKNKVCNIHFRMESTTQEGLMCCGLRDGKILSEGSAVGLKRGKK